MLQCIISVVIPLHFEERRNHHDLPEVQKCQRFSTGHQPDEAQAETPQYPLVASHRLVVGAGEVGVLVPTCADCQDFFPEALQDEERCRHDVHLPAVRVHLEGVRKSRDCGGKTPFAIPAFFHFLPPLLDVYESS